MKKNLLIGAALVAASMGPAKADSGLPGQPAQSITTPWMAVTASDGTGTVTDLTGSRVNGVYHHGAGAYLSFYPTIGYNAGDHQRAQALYQFTTTQDATVSETGISINAEMNTGLAKAWEPGTTYAGGALIDHAGNIYRAISGGTSAASGSGPAGTGAAIKDGSVTWAFQCVDQCNAKMPLFVSAVAGEGAGKVWAGDVALTLNPGWRGGFAPAWEVDMTNNSGVDCAACQNIFVSGDAGTNTIQAGISVYSPSSTHYQWINGYQVTGGKPVQVASYSDSASGTYSYRDTGAHTYGIYLNGIYGIGALWSNQALTMQYDNARLNFFPARTGNQWRLISNVTSAADGSIVMQHTTDAFGSNFTNTITALADGSVQVGKGLQLTGTTYAALPACNAGSAGYLAYITDASVAVTAWHQQVTAGGGKNAAFIACNGSGWYAFDY
jgi:hypothetical protein